MSNFKKLNTRIFRKDESIVTEDTLYWKKQGEPVIVKEFGPIDYVDFCNTDPHYFAVTCSVRVQIYNPVTKLVVKNLSKFKESAYGATFRADGRLLCSGGEETHVKLFDVTSRNLLRLFKGHSAAVHRTFFIPGRPQIVSFSDDKSLKTWDIPTEKEITSFSGHEDYVRAGAVSPVVPDIVFSGGYDNKIKVFDLRTNQATISMDHGAPVESLLCLPSGGIVFSAGGNYIKVWDILSGGKLLGNISEHHKTVTCLRLASDNKRLLSGSLDRHVKVYDLSNFRVMHTFIFPNGVSSLAISKNDETLVAGLVDGVLSINRRQEDYKSEKITNKKKKISSFKFSGHAGSVFLDEYVEEKKLETESKHDKCLRKFEHAKALESVLLNYVANKHPETTVAVIQELIKRKAFSKAIRGKEENFLSKLMHFFIRNIVNYRLNSIIIDAVNIFIDEYEDLLFSMSPDLKHLFNILSRLLEQETHLGNDLAALQGTMSMLMTSATQELSLENDDLHLFPSEEAQKNLVLNIT